MFVKGLDHLLFSVSDLDTSVQFYEQVFEAKLLVKGKTTAYFDVNGLWLALNEEKDISRSDIHHSYTHTAFSIDEEDYVEVYKRLRKLNVHILSGRPREQADKRSIYFTDPDGHKFEFHTGSLQDRMDYYRSEKRHMEFFDE
ncbi:metallothiol transferase FosB [Halobacillus campisalis]|uniref:Metallothiol transferase FosB n=1 Tax=Halobacillus campisalis TaxID=435909 RepID=A0ABW2JZ50_9BACI|nr:metallothiol transferase FosB [Halobacillus campisalis]